MKYGSSPLWLLLVLLSYMAPATAAIQWHVDAISTPGVAARDLSVVLTEDGSGALAVTVKAAAFKLDVLGWSGVRVECHGLLSRPTPESWHFEGALALHGAPGDALRAGTIALDMDHAQNTLDLALTERSGGLKVAWPLDDMGHMQMRLDHLPLAWLQGVLAQAWPQGRLSSGQVSATLSVDLDDNGLRSAGRYSLADGGFDSLDGTLAGATLASQGRWTATLNGADVRLDLDARLHGGELLLGPVYASLPDAPARLRVGAHFGAAGIGVDQLHFDDGSALRFDGSLGFDAKGHLDRLRVDGLRALLPAAYLHYGKSMLATAGFPDLTVKGMLTASAAWTKKGWQRFSVAADGLDVHDADERIGAEALSGKIDWAASGERSAERVVWNDLSLLGLHLGAASTRWQSRDGTLALLAPARIPMMGGAVFLNSLAWSPAASDLEDRVAASLAYTGIDLGALSKAFGWPEFAGTVGGAIPSLEYDGTRLRLGGGVAVHVFDGFVDVTELQLQHPFGPAPVLEAAVDFRDLDLKPMTEVFGFGSISGRLHGQIDGLRMVGWRPAAFSATLLADSGGRISQKAVNSISNLGGGGIAGGLQAAVLNVFDSFRYRRIGLSCVLHDGVCDMSGLGAADNGGYLIVEGRGLPHISVIGHQHRVDWPTLVTRLEEATHGGGVTIE